jgi:hypothetical protein
MANALYPKTKAQMLQGAINLLTADVRLILVDLGAYTYRALEWDDVNLTKANKRSIEHQISASRAQVA